ncbi:MAG: hypothetical protein ACOYNS_15190 [Bacteroidota bacterium]
MNYFRTENTAQFISVIRTLVIAVFCLLIGTERIMAQQSTIIGAAAVYEVPIGSLHERFLGTAGAMVFAGAEVSSKLTWVGKIQYSEFSSVNSDALNKSVTVGQGIGAQKVVLPLPKLTMDLKTTSVMAEAQLSLLRSEFADVNGIAGFGFTNWVNTRGAYYDSLFVKNAVSGLPEKVAALAVPAIRQEDWSGTVNLGIELTGAIIGPVWFTVGADYKLIVGELWQTLDLDLENVAGMQFVSIRAGVKAKL